MKTLSKIAITAIILVGLGLAYVVGSYAQQAANLSSASLTTNWTGYLVVGSDESIDPMPPRHPYPKTVAKVEIGLRSDGVVVWREAAKAK